MNRIKDADFMAKFPPALKKDESMAALGQIIADELHITAEETRKNIIYPNIDGLSEKWLDILAYDLHVDWYDYDYPIETKRAIIKDSVKIHQKLGTKYAVETALRNVYKNATVSEWFEYGGKPYYFKINIDTGGNSLQENAYFDILRKVQFYKNLRSHCDGIHINLNVNSAIVNLSASTGVGIILKVKPKIPEKIEVKETVHIIATGAVGETLKIKPLLVKQIEVQAIQKVAARVSEGNAIKIKAKIPEKLTSRAAIKTVMSQKIGNSLQVKGER